MEACGIDVYATARKTGFKIEVLTRRDQIPRIIYFSAKKEIKDALLQEKIDGKVKYCPSCGKLLIERYVR